MPDYWAQSDHLGLDAEGHLWLIDPRDPEADDRDLGPLERAELPEVPFVSRDWLEYERGSLVEEWEDAPPPEGLRAEARAVYYRGLMG